VVKLEYGNKNLANGRELQAAQRAVFIGTEIALVGRIREGKQCTNIYTVSTGFATGCAVASCTGVRELVEMSA
jgi:hypothetical protein